MRLFLTIGLPCCLLFALFSHASTRLTAPATPVSADLLVRIAAEDNWPPFSDQHGQGLSYQLVNAALASQGYQLQLEVVPYARALYLTARGKTDALWNVTGQANTRRDYLLHQTPLFLASSSLYYREQAQTYRSVAELPDRTVVGVMLGYEYGDLFEQHKHRFKLVEVSSHPQLIKLLAQGKVTVAIFFDDVLKWYLQRHPEVLVAPKRGALNHVSEIFVAFYKEGRRSPQLAQALDEGLARLKRNGEYQRLLQQHQVADRPRAAHPVLLAAQ